MPRADVSAANQKHADMLKAALAEERSKSTFACGGRIPITKAVSKDAPDSAGLINKSETLAIDAEERPVVGGVENAKQNAAPLSSDPVTVRFGEHGSGSKLTLPISGDDAALQALLAACQPATFGVGGEEVHDEEYRKATKLDTSEFCTDFCPYTSGIVNIINQLLVPSIDSKRSVKAELYKLNVYSGPSGNFKAHVDTPRSETQIGSLVVVLPSVFKGGDFSVRNGGKESLFTWSKHAGRSIQWCAFYSDCEHEVLTVTDGHRITLTYNLYLITRTDLQAGTVMSLKAGSLPLTIPLKAALSEPRFMYKGGKIGMYLIHRYPHTHPTFSKNLPRCLKGVDMAVYEIARALHMKRSLICTTKQSRSQSYFDNDFEEEEDSDGEETKVFGYYYPSLQTLSVDDEMMGYDDFSNLDGTHPMYEGEFLWLNKPTNKELSSAFLAYGNSPSLGVQYTNAALLIIVPSAKERQEAGHFSKEALYEAMEDYEHWGDTEIEEDEDEDDEDGDDQDHGWEDDAEEDKDVADESAATKPTQEQTAEPTHCGSSHV